MSTVEITPLSEFNRQLGPPPGTDTTHIIAVKPDVPPIYEPFVVSFGPQHPSMHGVFRLEAVLDGERILSVKPYVEYMHRNFEKHVENEEYFQIVPYVDRLDYCAAMTEEYSYCRTVEQLLDWPVPERAEYIRIIMVELNRIASHLLTLGTFGMDLGAMTPIFYCFREREHILDLFEMVSGARLLYNYMVVGGVNVNLPAGFITKTISFLDDFEKVFMPEYDKLLLGNSIYFARTIEIGVLTPEQCEAYGITGPNLRGSGVDWDLRKHYPYDPERPQGGYSYYDQFEYEIPVGDGAGGRGPVGACWDRIMVRYKEVKESVKIVRQALDKLPSGKIQHLLMPRTVRPNGHAFCSSETARGELHMRIIADGSDKPYRVHANSPGFNSIYALPVLCENVMVADLIAIVGSIDFVMGEVGR